MVCYPSLYRLAIDRQTVHRLHLNVLRPSFVRPRLPDFLQCLSEPEFPESNAWTSFAASSASYSNFRFGVATDEKFR
jgi:hypothetical protein